MSAYQRGTMDESARQNWIDIWIERYQRPQPEGILGEMIYPRTIGHLVLELFVMQIAG